MAHSCNQLIRPLSPAAETGDGSYWSHGHAGLIPGLASIQQNCIDPREELCAAACCGNRSESEWCQSR